MALINDYRVQFKGLAPSFWEEVEKDLLKSEAMDLIRILRKEPGYVNVTWRIVSPSKQYKKEVIE